MRKTLLPIIFTVLSSPLWADNTVENTADLNQTDREESEFTSDEHLEEGFLTSYLNRALERTMTTSATDTDNKVQYGRKVTDYVSVPKFGGYVIGSYKYSDQDGSKGGPGFNARLIRLYVDGTILRDFKYRIQVEMNGSPHIKDFSLDWQHWKEFGIKIGQYKRCFTFENPYNPWDVGDGDYATVVKKFAGMGDHNGEASMGGRDQGIQLHGDILPIGKDKHRLFHYELGLYNGQGINASDKNGRKDFIGTLQVQPVKDLIVGAFYWNGNTVINGVTVDRKRWEIGARYETDDWTARAEYIRSNGHIASCYDPTTDTFTDNGKADGWYVSVGVPFAKWLKTYFKYDVYRKDASNSTMRTAYSICPNFQLHRNLRFQVQYLYVNDKTAMDKHHNEVWVQSYVRF